MAVPNPTFRFRATLLKPAEPPRGASWAFFILPKDASKKLPRRGRVAVKGSINGHSFRATLEPDGQNSHWLKVSKRLREAAGIAVGTIVSLELSALDKEPEPILPADLRKALAAAPNARAVWTDITPLARQDWIHWITSAKREETRGRRIESACDMLASGKRRVCCFDRSGVYSKGFVAPKAAEL